jgi:pimeloyl-ACP methyl ester carboxylesterase
LLLKRCASLAYLSFGTKGLQLFKVITKYLFMFLLALGLSGLSSTKSFASNQSSCAASQGGGYVVAHDQRSDSVVVFIHGLGGDSVGTWTSGLIFKTYWPCLLKTDLAFSGSNVFAYEYPTSLFTAKTPVGRVATQLYSDLAANDIFSHKNVTLVVHSLGGLAASRMLLELNSSGNENHKAALAKVKHVMFYGVPADGNDLASLLSFFGGSEHVKDISDADMSATTLKRWKAVKWPFTFTCLAEGANVGLPFFGSRVVSEKSAFALCEPSSGGNSGQKVFLDSLNHSAIVKPSSPSEVPHKRLVTDYLLCVAPHQSKSSPVSPPDIVGTTAVKKWYEQLVSKLNKKTEGQTDLDIFSSQLARNLNNSFLAPENGAIGTFRVTRGLSLFVDDLANQVPTRIASKEYRNFAPILNLAKLADLPKIVRDKSVIELIQYAQMNINSNQDALVLIVGNKDPGFPSVLFIFDEKTDEAQSAVLRGFIILPPRSECGLRL